MEKLVVNSYLRLRFIAAICAFILAALAIFADLTHSDLGSKTTLVVSLDTGPSHFRNQLIHSFAAKIFEQSEGNLELEIYESGQLMSDRDVAKALALGLIDFAMPPDSKIARFEPNASLMSLPVFFGQNPDLVYQVVDGPVGSAVRESIEEQLKVKVLRPVVDLGFTSIYSTDKQLAMIKDYAGLKIRFPGGVGRAETLKQLGAIPVSVPFPDVPLALSQGNLDAIQSTHVTVRSVKLWDAGLKYCFEDNASFIQYIPMISIQALERLSQKHQAILFKAWKDVASGIRNETIEFQSDARRALIRNGVQCEEISPSAVDSIRDQLKASSRKIAVRIGMDMDIFESALTTLGVD